MGRSNSLYALKKLNGRSALYRIKLDSSLAKELVASNPKVDIDGVVRIGDGQKVIGYTYADDRRHTVYFDPEFTQACGVPVESAADTCRWSTFVNASDDGQKLLLFAGSDSDAGRYYIYDKGKKSLGEIVLARRELEGRTLASVKPVQYAAADGTLVPAYLTLAGGIVGQGIAGGRPSPRRAKRARRMEFRLDRAIPGGARLCGDPAELPRLRRFRRCLAGEERVPGMAHLDRRRLRRGALAGRAGHRRSPSASPSSAGPTAAMRRCSRWRPSRACTGRPWRSRRSPTCCC